MTRIAKFYACMIVISLVYAYGTWQLKIGTPGDPKSGFFPLIVAILLLVTSISLFVEALKKGDTWKNIGEFPPLWGLKRVGAVIALLGLYVLCFEPVGFIISTTVLLGILLRMLRTGSWLKIAVVCAVLVGGAYALFDLTLDVPLPMGLLEDIL